MEQPTTHQPDYPMTPDGKYKYTTWDGRPKHYPSTELPGFYESPILPVWLTTRLKKLFKRAPEEP